MCTPATSIYTILHCTQPDHVENPTRRMYTCWEQGRFNVLAVRDCRATYSGPPRETSCTRPLDKTRSVAARIPQSPLLVSQNICCSKRTTLSGTNFVLDVKPVLDVSNLQADHKNFVSALDSAIEDRQSDCLRPLIHTIRRGSAGMAWSIALGVSFPLVHPQESQ